MVRGRWSVRVVTRCALIGVPAADMATPTKKSSKSKQPARELDTANATKGVWLVKVPNYLSDVWKEAEPNSDLGIMRISTYVCTVHVLAAIIHVCMYAATPIICTQM